MYHEWCSITSKWAHFKILANSVWAIFLFLPLCYVKIPSNWQPYKGPSPHTVNMKPLYCTGIVRHFDPPNTLHCPRGMRVEGQWGRVDQNWVSTWCSNTHPTARFWLPTFMTCSISLTLLQTKDWRSYKKHNTNYIFKWLYIFNSLFLNFEPIYKK